MRDSGPWRATSGSFAASWACRRRGAKGHEMVAGCLEATRARQEAVGLVLEDLEEESGRGSLVGADSPSACVTQPARSAPTGPAGYEGPGARRDEHVAEALPSLRLVGRARAGRLARPRREGRGAGVVRQVWLQGGPPGHGHHEARASGGRAAPRR